MRNAAPEPVDGRGSPIPGNPHDATDLLDLESPAPSRSGAGEAQASFFVIARTWSTSVALLKSASDTRPWPSRTVTSVFAWSNAARTSLVGFVV